MAAEDHFIFSAKIGHDDVDDVISRYEREEAREQGKRAPAARRKRKPPEELAYLLEWYDHCRGGMQRGQEAEPLSHQEIESFRNLHGLQDIMLSFDVLMLRRLDGVWWSKLPKIDPAPPPPVYRPKLPFGPR